MAIFKVVNAMACEYAAQGASNRHTLVNVYGGGEIRVQSYPAVFPVAFYLELVPNFIETQEVKLEVQVGRKTRAFVEIEVGPMPDDVTAFVLPMPPFPLTVTKDTEVRVVASYEGSPKMVILKRRIRLGSAPA